MAEWSIAAVLKTVELRGSGGSNPSLSALNNLQEVEFQPCRFFLCPKSCTKNAPTPFLRTSTGVFLIAHIPYILSHFSRSVRQHEMRGVIFYPFQSKRCTKKGNHPCSSLLKMTFHKHSPLLIADSKIGSHRLKVLVSRVCSNHLFCPSFFCTMHDKSSSSCVCRKDVAYPCCDVASVSSAILCFAHLPCYPQLARNLLQ